MSARALGWGALGLALAPWAPMRLAWLTVLLAVLAAGLDRGIIWSVERVRSVLLAIGLIALVISPYWAIAPTPGWRLVGFVVNTAVVVSWSRLAAGRWRLKPGGGPGLVGPGVVCAAMLGFCGPGLFASIEYRGDEDFFLLRPLRIIEAVVASSPAAWPMLGASVLALILGVFGGRLRRRVCLASAAALPVLVGALFVIWQPEPTLLLRLARYSVLGSWVHTALAFSPLHALPALSHVVYEESLYRLGSFGSALVLTLLAWRAAPGPAGFRVCAALLVGTTPSVLYFSSVVYPDLIAVSLATAGLVTLSRSVRHRMSDRPDTSLTVPLLALAALTKESFVPLVTTLAFGAPLVLLLHQRQRPSAWTFMGRAARFGFGLLAPVAVYVVWRHLAEDWILGGRFRPLEASVSALGNPALARVLTRASQDQFGPLLLLGVVACLRLRHRRAFPVLLLLGSIMAQLLFLGVEGIRSTPWGPLPNYAGFARYQLTLLPGLVLLAVLGVRYLWRSHRATAWTVVGLGLAWNLVAAPVARDGSRPAFWGDYVFETSGERYPYDSFYGWLHGRQERGDVTIIGRGYPYGDDFYLRKYGLKCRIVAPIKTVPKSPLVMAGVQARAEITANLISQLTRFASGDHRLVVLHVSQWIDPADLPPRVLELHRTITFRLGDAFLLVYERPRNGAPAERSPGR